MLNETHEENEGAKNIENYLPGGKSFLLEFRKNSFTPMYMLTFI